MTAYDPNNIFAKILRGEFPCYKVYEDDHVLAFLDIMPRSPGHTLVIPKAPARNILDITAEDFAHVARGTHRIARAAMTGISGRSCASESNVRWHLSASTMTFNGSGHTSGKFISPSNRMGNAKRSSGGAN